VSLCLCHLAGCYLLLPEGICRKAYWGLWTGFRLLHPVFRLTCCGGVTLPRRAPPRVDFSVRSPEDCLCHKASRGLFSTGWELIVRANLGLCFPDLIIYSALTLFPSKLLEFFFCADELDRAIIEQNAPAFWIVVVESK
jgi:hypothetical protein